jgi:hypothetical protein
MSIFTQFETDRDKEKTGIPLTFSPNDDGSVPTFMIARAGGVNQNYHKTLNRKAAPYRHLLDMDAMPAERSNEILMETYAESVILGWENVQDKDNKVIPYSQENCLSLLKSLPELFAQIQRWATNHAKFAAVVSENEIKNS